MEGRVAFLIVAAVVMTGAAALTSKPKAPAAKPEAVTSATKPRGPAAYNEAFDAGVKKFKRRKYVEAIADLKTALGYAEKGEQTSGAQVLIGICLHRLEEYDKAERALGAVVAMKDAPGYHRGKAQMRVGCVQCHVGPTETVVRAVPKKVYESFAKVVAMKDAVGRHKGHAQRLIGQCYRRTKRYPEAIAAYNKVLRIKGARASDVAQALRKIVVCHRALGQHEKAIETCLKIQLRKGASEKDIAEAHYNIGLCRVVQARAAFQKVLDSPRANAKQKQTAKRMLERLAVPG